MSPKILLVSGLTCVLMPQLLSPQVLIAQSVRVGQPRAVEIGLQDRPLIEPHLAVHPSNPNHLLGTAMVATTDQASNAAEFRRIGIERTCVTFHSLDGGETWSRHDFPLTSCFDPWVAITPEGHAVLSVLAEDPALPNQNEGMVVYHSVDGGKTWAPEPVGLGDRHDHQTMVVDVSTPGREDWLYIVSSRGMQAEETGSSRGIFVVRSRDGGRSFDTPTHLVSGNMQVNAETPVVLPDGALLVPFVDPWRETPQGAVEVQYRRGWVYRSEDGGQVFSEPKLAMEGCGPPRFSLSAAAADVGASSPWRGRTYFACNERGGGGVLVAYSPDGGEAWNQPVAIHAPQSDTVQLHQVMGMAVSEDGVLGVTWIGRTGPQRDDFPNPCYEVFFSASVDGGDSFLPEQRISTGRSCTTLAINGAAARGWPTGGDYYGMVATSQGRFQVLWPETRDTVYQLNIATIEVR